MRRLVSVQIGERLTLVCRFVSAPAEPDVGLPARWEDDGVESLIIEQRGRDAKGARTYRDVIHETKYMPRQVEMLLCEIAAAYRDEIESLLREEDVTR